MLAPHAFRGGFWLSRRRLLIFGGFFWGPAIHAHLGGRRLHRRPSDEAHNSTIAWGKQKTQAALRVLDQSIIGDADYVANNRISIADYFGAGLMCAGEIIRCTFDDYPNVQRWIGNMKKLNTWAAVHEVMYGFAASVKDKEFERV